MVVDPRWLEQAQAGRDLGRVAGELFCVGCGYDLRGLGRAGVCPECGRPVAASIGGRGAAFSIQNLPPDLQRALCLGGYCAGLAVLPLVILLPLFLRVAGKLSTEAHWVMTGLTFVASVAWSLGVFMLAARLPSEPLPKELPGFDAPLGLSHVAQVTQVGWVVLVLQLAAAPWTPPMLAYPAQTVGVAAAVFATLGLAPFGIRVLRLMRDVSDEQLSNRMLWFTWSLTPAITLTAAMAQWAGSFPRPVTLEGLIWWLGLLASIGLAGVGAHALVDFGNTLRWAEANSDFAAEREARRAARRAAEDARRLRSVASMDRRAPAAAVDTPPAGLNPIPLADDAPSRPVSAPAPPTPGRA